MDKEAVKKSAAEWVENPYWAKYHDEAPTPECRAYVELEFYANDTDDEEAWETMDKLKNGFGIEDWKHLLKFSGDNPEKTAILRKIEELEKEAGKLLHEDRENAGTDHE